jgi:Zn ribbon nucleic-acid-binding protein
MGEFLRHEPCPNCGSKDNLGVWEDHKWCFGCGHYEGPKDRSLEQLRKLVGKFQLSDKDYDNNKKGKNEYVFLPDDCTRTLPADPAEWLKKYGITEQEVLSNHLCWSPTHERLYFPVFDLYGNLVAYQGRFFGADPKVPRYSTRGKVDNVFHFIGDVGNGIVVCEDFLSAVKIGRHFCAMPLWGSQISLERMIKLGDRFKNLIIWLDRDKAKYAVKQKITASIFFDRVEVIITENDPKEHTNGEIANLVSVCLR